jgi:hypothetical protein
MRNFKQYIFQRSDLGLTFRQPRDNTSSINPDVDRDIIRLLVMAFLSESKYTNWTTNILLTVCCVAIDDYISWHNCNGD